MPTTSFNKKFVIKTKKAAEELLEALDNPEIIKVDKKNIDEENKSTLELLRERFPHLKKQK